MTVKNVHINVFSGVAPSSGDHWTDEVKTFFLNQVIDKTFIVYVLPFMDVTMASSASEDCWSVVLVESLPNKTFIYVDSVLAKCPGVRRL